MKKSILFFLFWFCSTLICHSQTTATIKIMSDQDITAQIFGNIDEAFQPYYYSITQLSISKHIPLEYVLDVGEWAFIQINLPQRLFLLLCPDDNVTIINHDGNILIEGSNAVGHQYYDQNWNGTQNFIAKLESSLWAINNYSEYLKIFQADFVLPEKRKIDTMLNNKDVSECYASIIKLDIEYYQYTCLIQKLKALHLNKSLTDAQKLQISSLLEILYEQISTYDDTLGLRLYLGSSFIKEKYSQAYAALSISERNVLHEKYSSSTFGPYLYYLIAPQNVQIAEFFDCIMIQYIYQVNEFNSSALIKYLREIAPTAESVQILSKIETNQTKDSDDNNIKYIDLEINTLKDIVNIPDLTGNYCLVDLWATWCVPCRQDFSYNKDLHNLLLKYNNIKQVYVSIDDIAESQKWQELIKTYDLTGVHFIANPQLIHTLTNEIYTGKSITIPRYILLSPDGDVLCSNLPRPNNLQKLATLLNMYLSK